MAVTARRAATAGGNAFGSWFAGRRVPLPGTLRLRVGMVCDVAE
jgi:hypothetical protein